MIRIRSKKGSVSPVEDLIEYIFKMTAIIAVFSVVFLLIRSFVVYDVDIFEAESNVMSYRLIYGENSLSYYDPIIERLYPGVIDLERFNQDSFGNELTQANYFSIERHFSAEITLYDIDGNVYGPVYVNEGEYQKWLPIARSKATGPGSAKLMEKSFYVLLKDRAKKEIIRLQDLKDLKELDSWIPFSQEDEEEMERLKSSPVYQDMQMVPGKAVIRVIIPNS